MQIARNNPGNIRKNAAFVWQGELPGVIAPNFVQFDTLVNGFRAQIKLLNNYIKAGNNNLSKIINRWAPPSDNNPTNAYINYVAGKTGINQYETISVNDFDTLGRIAFAMAHFEHGIKTDDGTMSETIEKAKNILRGIVDVATTAVKNNPLAMIVGIALLIYIFKKL